MRILINGWEHLGQVYCQNCSSTLEYTHDDVKETTRTSSSVQWESDMVQKVKYVVCPVCDASVMLPKYPVLVKP